MPLVIGESARAYSVFENDNKLEVKNHQNVRWTQELHGGAVVSTVTSQKKGSLCKSLTCQGPFREGFGCSSHAYCGLPLGTPASSQLHKTFPPA